MPLSWPTLFRLAVLIALSVHELTMYRVARTISGPARNDASDIILAALFALAMLVPLVWAVTLPDLPEIYTRVVRGRRRFRRGECPTCAYNISASAGDIHLASGSRCPECGAVIARPGEYTVTRRTITRYVVMNFGAWAIGCVVGEWLLRL